MRGVYALSVCSLLALALPAHAHHEAIFGPQSSLVFSSPGFVSLQLFSRRLGSGSAGRQESTGLVSAGFSPFDGVPLSFTVIAPASHIAGPGAEARTGPEDLVVGSRYRFDLTGLQSRWNSQGNFLLGMAAAELPLGNVDHPALQGPLGGMFAALGSVERGPFSAIGYGFYKLHGSSGGQKRGDNLFLGGGVAWTPSEEPGGRLFSAQLGWSYESYFKNRVAGALDDGTGGTAVLAHPTLVFGPGGNLLVFALCSIPVWQSYRNPADEDRWRVGGGVTWLFGH